MAMMRFHGGEMDGMCIPPKKEVHVESMTHNERMYELSKTYVIHCEDCLKTFSEIGNIDLVERSKADLIEAQKELEKYRPLVEQEKEYDV